MKSKKGYKEVVDNSTKESHNESKTVQTITMEEFLSTSREIKQQYNSYLLIGFRKYYNTLRTKNTSIPYKQTYDDWRAILKQYAELNL